MPSGHAIDGDLPKQKELAAKILVNIQKLLNKIPESEHHLHANLIEAQMYMEEAASRLKSSGYAEVYKNQQKASD